jgi:hypothetical protein
MVYRLYFLLEIYYERECLIKEFVLVASSVRYFMFASTNMKIIKTSFLYLELLGFWSFSTVRYAKEHNVSETGSVSVLR